MKKKLFLMLLSTAIAFVSCKKEDAVSVDGVTLNKPELVLTKGTSEVLTASVSPENADNKSVVWRSKDETIAKVSDKGEVTALKVGTTTIDASTVDGSKIAPCTVRVTPESTVAGFVKATYEVPEYTKAGVIEIPVSIQEEMKGDITCTVQAVDGTAVGTGADWDYKLKTTEVKIANKTKEGKVVVEINDSRAMKEDRSFKLIIKTVTSDCQTEKVTVSSTLAECEVIIKKVVREATFEKAVINVNKQMNPMDFGVCLTGPVDRDVTITFQPKAGATAIEGTHFRLASHQLTIKKGETIATTKLEILQDVDGYCEFEITEVTGNVDMAVDATCRLNIQKTK